MITLQISHSDLGRYLPDNRKTGAVRIDLSSKTRKVSWLVLRKNGLIDLAGVSPNGRTWRQTYRHHAPIDD